MTPYQKHKEKWSKCRECDLCRTRSNVVLGRGRLPADVLFIGEAPGTSENVLGKPFIGPAGKLLDRIILDAEVTSYFITNVVACIPVDPQTKQKVTEPEEDHVLACRPRLLEIVQLCRPKLVVCLGKIAEVYTRPLHTTRYWPHSQLNLIHPAAILRMDIGQRDIAIKRCVVDLESAVQCL